MVNYENLDQNFCKEHKIISFPLFFIIKDGKIEKKLEIETGLCTKKKNLKTNFKNMV